MLQKYFIAIIPPQLQCEEISSFKEYIYKTFNSHGALQSPPHITLHMPFSFEENKEDVLLTCLQNFKFSKDCTIQLKNFNCFEPRVIFINVIENQLLFQLQKSLVQHVKSNLNIFNQSDDLRGFHPHVTIAFRDLKKQTFYKVWEEFKSKNYEATFQTSEIALLKKGNLNWEVYKTFKFTS